MFELLEERAKLRLEDLMHLRRLSRQSGKTLLEEAHHQGAIEQPLAVTLAQDLGLDWSTLHAEQVEKQRFTEAITDPHAAISATMPYAPVLHFPKETQSQPVHSAPTPPPLPAPKAPLPPAPPQKAPPPLPHPSLSHPPALNRAAASTNAPALRTPARSLPPVQPFTPSKPVSAMPAEPKAVPTPSRLPPRVAPITGPFPPPLPSKRTLPPPLPSTNANSKKP